MRVLVAGDRGYIGTVLVPAFRRAGHEVSGLDTGLYEGCDLGSGPEPFRGARRDIRDVTVEDVAGYDAVVCLAALSNDPLGHLNREATFSINLGGPWRWRGRRDPRGWNGSFSPRPAACTGRPVRRRWPRTRRCTR